MQIDIIQNGEGVVPITIKKDTPIFFSGNVFCTLQDKRNCKAYVFGHNYAELPDVIEIMDVSNFTENNLGNCGIIYDCQDGFYFEVYD